MKTINLKMALFGLPYLASVEAPKFFEKSAVSNPESRVYGGISANENIQEAVKNRAEPLNEVEKQGSVVASLPLKVGVISPERSQSEASLQWTKQEGITSPDFGISSAPNIIETVKRENKGFFPLESIRIAFDRGWMQLMKFSASLYDTEKTSFLLQVAFFEANYLFSNNDQVNSIVDGGIGGRFMSGSLKYPFSVDIAFFGHVDAAYLKQSEHSGGGFGALMQFCYSDFYKVVTNCDLRIFSSIKENNFNEEWALFSGLMSGQLRFPGVWLPPNCKWFNQLFFFSSLGGALLVKESHALDQNQLTLAKNEGVEKSDLYWFLVQGKFGFGAFVLPCLKIFLEFPAVVELEGGPPTTIRRWDLNLQAIRSGMTLRISFHYRSDLSLRDHFSIKRTQSLNKLCHSRYDPWDRNA